VWRSVASRSCVASRGSLESGRTGGEYFADVGDADLPRLVVQQFGERPFGDSVESIVVATAFLCGSDNQFEARPVCSETPLLLLDDGYRKTERPAATFNLCYQMLVN